MPLHICKYIPASQLHTLCSARFHASTLQDLSFLLYLQADMKTHTFEMATHKYWQPQNFGKLTHETGKCDSPENFKKVT